MIPKHSHPNWIWFQKQINDLIYFVVLIKVKKECIIWLNRYFWRAWEIRQKIWGLSSILLTQIQSPAAHNVPWPPEGIIPKPWVSPKYCQMPKTENRHKNEYLLGIIFPFSAPKEIDTYFKCFPYKLIFESLRYHK